MEDCFFFKNSTYNLFGCLHKPDKPERRNGIGLVICSPFAEEKLWSHRVIVNFARCLANNGFSVLRFDYMGHGDSEGSFEDSDIETRLSDIKCAVDIIKEQFEIHKIGLLGLRLGAALAAVYAERDLTLAFLVLWEPIIHVETYLKQCLRANLATQMSTYKKIKYTRKQMIEDFKAGKNINIDGYLMSADLFQQASSIDLVKRTLEYSGPVNIMHISKIDNVKAPIGITELHQKYKQKNSSAELNIITEEPFWQSVKAYYQKSDNLFNATLDFFNKIQVLG